MTARQRFAKSHLSFKLDYYDIRNDPLLDAEYDYTQSNTIYMKDIFCSSEDPDELFDYEWEAGDLDLYTGSRDLHIPACSLGPSDSRDVELKVYRLGT